MRRFGLSKSKITAFEQCPKKLWLATHRPELAQQDEGAETRFATGHVVGDEACRQGAGGVMVEAVPDLAAAIATTRALIESGHDGPIFEATFQRDGVLVRCDLLEPDGAGAWRMAEVKSSGGPKPYHAGDLATQIWVVEGAGVPLTGAAIRHIDTSFVLEREGDYGGIFADAEMLADLAPIVAERGGVVAAARIMLAGSEPDVDVGDHCESPFACEFSAYCHAHLPEGPKWPVTVLPHGGGKKWLAMGINDLLALDPLTLTNAAHAKVFQATASGVPFHDRDGARAAMADWAFPRTWLDFETIAFALPRWVGTRPYEQVPFQFSAHVQGEDGAMRHIEFLSLDGADPRRACAEALATLPGEGAVIAYNAGFERGVIVKLAAAFPDLTPALELLAARLVDLLPVARAHWYHRDQRGSWSLKAVLPTVAPALDYAGLEVKDGGNAQAAYLEAVDPCTATDRRSALDSALRAYCGRDTEAMVFVARTLAA